MEVEKLTTIGLVCAIQAVSLPVTEEGDWEAAGLVIAVVGAALHVRHTLRLIRAVLTLGHAVTHLTVVDALLPMGALELP